MAEQCSHTADAQAYSLDAVTEGSMTRRQFTPRDYQRIAVEFMAQTPRCNLWAGMGDLACSV